MIVVTAAGIKCSTTERAAVITLQVTVNRHFLPAYSTKHSIGIKFMFGPLLGGVISGCFMAINTGIVYTAAFHPDSNDIQCRMIMNASCTIIYGISFNYYIFRFTQVQMNVTYFLVRY